MLRQFSTYFWCCLILFTFNQFIEKAGIYIPYIHSYLDDVLCPGIVLGFTLWFQQRFTYKNWAYIFNYKLLIVFVIWYSLLFEVWFPYNDTRHHADFFDVIAYAVGTLIFARFGNKRKIGVVKKTSVSA